MEDTAPPGTSRDCGRYRPEAAAPPALVGDVWIGKRLVEISVEGSLLWRLVGAGEEGRERAAPMTARLRASTWARRWDSSVEMARARPLLRVEARLSSPKMDSRWVKRSRTRR